MIMATAALYKNNGVAYALVMYVVCSFSSLPASLPRSFLFRLYWFPVKVCYSANHVSLLVLPKIPYWTVGTTFLWVLYAIQVGTEMPELQLHSVMGTVFASVSRSYSTNSSPSFQGGGGDLYTECNVFPGL